MLVRNLGWWRKLVLAVPLVTVAFALEHAGPRGIPTAEGCSGGFSYGEGWAELRVSASTTIEGQDGITRSAIASDGFVVLDGEYDDRELDIDVSGVHATMTNADGVEVPGTLRFLRAVTGYRSSHGKTVYLGWEPGSAFEVGERLSARRRSPGRYRRIRGAVVFGLASEAALRSSVPVTNG